MAICSGASEGRALGVPLPTVQLDPYLILLSLVFLDGAEDTSEKEDTTWTCASLSTGQEVPHAPQPPARGLRSAEVQDGPGLQALWFSASGLHSAQLSWNVAWCSGH